MKNKRFNSDRKTGFSLAEEAQQRSEGLRGLQVEEINGPVADRLLQLVFGLPPYHEKVVPAPAAVPAEWAVA